MKNKINYDMTIVERMLSHIRPKWGYGRMIDRVQGELYRSHFAAAEKGSVQNDWRKLGFNRNQRGFNDFQGERRLIAERARSVTVQNSHGRAALDTLVNIAIGKGIVTQSKIEYTLDPEINEFRNTQIEDAKKRWMEKEADFYGELHYYDMERLMMRTVAAEGEGFKLKRFKSGRSRSIPLSYEVFGMDRLATTSKVRPRSGNYIVDGIEYNEQGIVVAYWIEVNPGFRSVVKRFSANRIEHIYRKDWMDQNRGISWFAAMIPDLYLLEDIKRYKLVSYKVQSAMALIISRDPAGMGAAPSLLKPDDQPINNDIRRSSIEPGMALELPYMAKIDSFNPAQSRDLEPMTKLVLRGAGVGIGLSYEYLTGDFSDMNFAGGRISGMNTKRNMNCVSTWFIRRSTQIDHEAFMTQGYQANLFPTPPARLATPLGVKNVDPFNARHTIPKFDMSVNPVQDVTAAALSVAQSFKSIRQVIEENGGDFEETIKQILTEQELGAKFGIDLHEIITNAMMLNPQENAA